MLNRRRRSMRHRVVRVVDEVVAAHHREYEAALTVGIDRVLRAVHEVEFRSRRDLWSAGEREAATSSERFVRDVMVMPTPARSTTRWRPWHMRCPSLPLTGWRLSSACTKAAL